ncbi:MULTISPECIES: FadD32-like long-chain-fatty-acid--AMP ligase [unclassified Corynebacterium]|uniref:FadD32-like long-chain-fatty-acid--AMP ligase n=1 Tax=unclassified Corynebacterium TaxID=2624378 RepID=UPI0029CAA10B|nr:MULTISPECIES: FadD32-like long-chain-fatty-acid--AMP ligase [unclassified Corynebacterium]WPF66016.1 FadD32-like long-chain-fatty-acid--AMP ligase [Corynebacterium sp. 22KM0430]WPF68509.1 FadD32-like long-chain-fatty-acid--AMP ligase [Corynebacterium sp. 21KM1197]
MNLQSALASFFNEKGEIAIDPRLTLPGLSELLYQKELAAGGGERPALRYWDYQGTGGAVDYTRSQINTRIKAVAARLQQVGQPGQRVAILMGNTPEYLFGFLGALYAGMTPVPLYDPREPGHDAHLRAVFHDSNPRLVLTNKLSAQAVRAYFSDLPGGERPRIIAIDALPDAVAASWTNPLEKPEAQAYLAERGVTAPLDLPAFLQYTSGSTRTPAGVMLTHRSVITNTLQIFAAGRLRTPMRLILWIPLHHDMGIILGMFALILGFEAEIMAPRDFVQQPSRWIEQMSKRDQDDDLAVYTVVPNFALDLAVRYGNPGENTDLSLVDGLVLGSEPITERSVTAFYEKFKDYGLQRSSLRPTYGLAEASLLVSTPQTEERPVIAYFDREALSEGRAQKVEKGHPAAVPLISNGQSVAPQRLAVVNPETRQEVPDGTIGELWNHGEHMAAGYLNRPEETAETFANTLAGRLAEGSRAAGAPDEGWLATGDLGAIIDDEVFITGRLKDLIVIAGRNHYPQDIEFTVGQATEQVEPTAIAAFSIPGEDVEHLVILAERVEGAAEDGDAEAIQAIRTAVSAAHGVTPKDVQILAAGSIARTSSAKIARRVARKHYLG